MKFFNKRLDLSEGEFDCLLKYIDFEKMEEAAKNLQKESKKLNN